MKNSINNQRGMALAIILISFTVIAIIASITLSVALGDVRQSVNTEKFVDASYKARVAADAVATDIEKKLNELHILKLAMDSAADEDKLDAIADYEAKWDEIYSVLNMVPTAGGVTTMYVADVAPNPIKVDVYNKSIGSEQYIEVHTVYSDGLYSGNAKIRLGKFESIVEDYTIPAFDGKNALYSWGDMEIGNGTPTIVGYVSAGGDIDSKKVAGTEGDKRTISIIPPPSSILSQNKSGSVKRTNIISGNKVTLTAADSGYYGALPVNDMDLIVDTSQGDVTIIVDSMSVGKNGGQIVVTGENNFYIYFKETYTGTIKSSSLLGDSASGQNHLNITGMNSDNKPQTYFIAYNDYMQKWVSEHEGEEKYVIPVSAWETMTVLDTYDIKNGPDFNAYLYLPFGDLTIKNKASVLGSVYAGNIDLKNSPTVQFIPFNEGDPLFTYGGDSTIGESVPAVVTTFNLTKNKIWLK